MKEAPPRWRRRRRLSGRWRWRRSLGRELARAAPPYKRPTAFVSSLHLPVLSPGHGISPWVHRSGGNGPRPLRRGAAHHPAPGPADASAAHRQPSAAGGRRGGAPQLPLPDHPGAQPRVRKQRRHLPQPRQAALRPALRLRSTNRLLRTVPLAGAPEAVFDGSRSHGDLCTRLSKWII